MASMTFPVRITRPTVICTHASGYPDFFTVKFVADVLISWDDLGSTSLSIALRLVSPVMHDLSLFAQELSAYAV